MRSVSNTFFNCFQLTTLFNKIIPALLPVTIQREIFTIPIGKQEIFLQNLYSTRIEVLFAQTKALNQRTITISAAALKVIKQFATPTHHAQ